MKIYSLILKKRNLILLALILISYLLLRPAPSFQSQNNNQNTIKGVWLTNLGVSIFHHTTSLDNVFHHLALSGYTHVYISTYGLGGTIYPSKQVQSHPLFLLPFTDVLQASQSEAKRQGLKLYAWLEYGLMLHPNNHIAVSHPDWLLQTSTGETIVNDFVWLNPEHPQVQEYILSIIQEVAQYKDLAGIQLDDHWAIPIQFGDYTRSMNQLTAKVKQHLEKSNPNLIFSLSPNPYHFSLGKYNQDWLYWARQGYIDEVVIQIYRPDSIRFKESLITSQIDDLPKSIPVGIGIYAGNPDNFQTPSEIQKQIEITQDLGYGFAIFCWEYKIMGSFFAP